MIEKEIKQNIELSLKLNPKDIQNINEVINDFISKNNIASINIDKYFEDDDYKYFIVIAIFDDNENLSKLAKLKRKNNG